MNKKKMIQLLEYILGGAIWSIVFIIAGMIIERISTLTLSDVLFFEGLIIILISGIVLIGVVPTWMSIRLLGQNAVQDAYHANPENEEIEEIEEAEIVDKVSTEDKIETADKEKNSCGCEPAKRIIRKPVRFFFNLISIIISGVICILVAIFM